jgi:hypothetical protein
MGRTRAYLETKYKIEACYLGVFYHDINSSDGSLCPTINILSKSIDLRTAGDILCGSSLR